MRLRRTIGLGIAAALASVGALSAALPAGARDLASIRADAQAVADEVSRLEARLADLESRASDLAEEIDGASSSLARLQLALEGASDALEVAQDKYVDEAVEAYKLGPSSHLTLLLSSQTLSDLFEIAQITEHIATLDSDSIDELEVRRNDLLDTQADIDSRKQDLLAARQAAEQVAADIGATLDERRGELKDLNRQIADLEEKARAAAEAAAASSGSTVGQALLDILGGSGPSSGIPDGFASTGVTFEGLASWYGPGFEGNPTASGDIFDSSLYTAASKELALGSWLYIEFEGKGVVVYVNDRGPYVGERILDLSRAAAEAIGLTGPGVGWVKAEILLKT